MKNNKPGVNPPKESSFNENDTAITPTGNSADKSQTLPPPQSAAQKQSKQSRSKQSSKVVSSAPKVKKTQGDPLRHAAEIESLIKKASWLGRQGHTEYGISHDEARENLEKLVRARFGKPLKELTLIELDELMTGLRAQENLVHTHHQIKMGESRESSPQNGTKKRKDDGNPFSSGPGDLFFLDISPAGYEHQAGRDKGGRSDMEDFDFPGELDWRPDHLESKPRVYDSELESKLFGDGNSRERNDRDGGAAYYGSRHPFDPAIVVDPPIIPDAFSLSARVWEKDMFELFRELLDGRLHGIIQVFWSPERLRRQRGLDASTAEKGYGTLFVEDGRITDACIGPRSLKGRAASDPEAGIDFGQEGDQKEADDFHELLTGRSSDEEHASTAADFLFYLIFLARSDLQTAGKVEIAAFNCDEYVDRQRQFLAIEPKNLLDRLSEIAEDCKDITERADYAAIKFFLNEDDEGDDDISEIRLDIDENSMTAVTRRLTVPEDRTSPRAGQYQWQSIPYREAVQTYRQILKWVGIEQAKGHLSAVAASVKRIDFSRMRRRLPIDLRGEWEISHTPTVKGGSLIARHFEYKDDEHLPTYLEDLGFVDDQLYIAENLHRTLTGLVVFAGTQESNYTKALEMVVSRIEEGEFMIDLPEAPQNRVRTVCEVGNPIEKIHPMRMQIELHNIGQNGGGDRLLAGSNYAKGHTDPDDVERDRLTHLVRHLSETGVEVIVWNHIESPAAFHALCRMSLKKHLVIISIAARSTEEALDRLLYMAPSSDVLASALKVLVVGNCLYRSDGSGRAVFETLELSEPSSSYLRRVAHAGKLVSLVKAKEKFTTFEEAATRLREIEREDL